MTLENLKYALYLNNIKLIELIDNVQDAVNSIAGTDITNIKNTIQDLQNLIDKTKEDIKDLSETSIAEINQKISDIQKDISDLQLKDVEMKEYIDTKVSDLISDINKTLSSMQLDAANLLEMFNTHNNDTVIHVTADDKNTWNAILANAKQYAKALFDGVTNFTVNIVSVLPDEPIPMVIYFIPNGNGDNDDYYDEYMYIGDKWEKIGNTYVNLEPYALKADVAATLLDYLTIADFDIAKESILKAITPKADKQWVIDEYTSKKELTSILLNYLTVQDFNAKIADYATVQSVKDALDKYINADDLKDNYALKTDLHTHTNKNVIDKLTDINGKLLYDGNEIVTDQVTISQANKNAVQVKSDGIYVEDKTEDIKDINKDIENIQKRTKQISIAQKTINNNETSKVLLDQMLSAESGTYSLLDNVSNYEYVLIEHCSDNSFQSTLFKTEKLLESNEEKPCAIVHGRGSTEAWTSFYFKDNAIVVVECYRQYITKIIGVLSLNKTIDPVEYVNTTQGLEDTPVGHILSFMGVTPPTHYLVCDGSIYNITDYKYLADFINKEFGSYDYFGGNGIDTFAVPDLRNNFIRGYHGNAESISGDIGKFQEATSHANVGTYFDGVHYANIGGYYSIGSTYVNNPDMLSDDKSMGAVYCDERRLTDAAHKNVPTSYTSRPRNTAVLYCIKYEPTYFMNISQTASAEELNMLKLQVETLQKELQAVETGLSQISDIFDSINRVVVK